MKKEIAKKFVEELRTTTVPQTTGSLVDFGENNERCYCAMGVLCLLYQKETGEEVFKAGDTFGLDYIDFQHHEFDDKVREWAGIPTIIWGPIIDDENNSVANLNDEGKTFAEIADLIERKFVNV